MSCNLRLLWPTTAARTTTTTMSPEVIDLSQTASLFLTVVIFSHLQILKKPPTAEDCKALSGWAQKRHSKKKNHRSRSICVNSCFHGLFFLSVSYFLRYRKNSADVGERYCFSRPVHTFAFLEHPLVYRKAVISLDGQHFDTKAYFGLPNGSITNWILAI